MSLTGNWRVRIFRPAFDEVRRLCPKTRDCIEVRRQVLKLRFWPGAVPVDPGGPVVDLNWSWIRSMPNMQTGELRIDDQIAGHDNLRAIFLVGDHRVQQPLPMIWILTVFQKKRDDFTSHQVSIFRGRRQLVLERFYADLT